MSGITINGLGAFSNKDLETLKDLAAKAAAAQAKADLQASFAKAAAAQAKADAKAAYELSEEGKKAVVAAQVEAERLARFKDSLDAVEDADCYVINGQLNNRKIYKVFSSMTAAQQWSKDLVKIGGRVYTRTPEPCKMK
jgi:NhaP-type Na+/H+ and K+/H+ antiporter